MELVLAFLLGFIVALIGVLTMRVGTMVVYIPDREDESPYLTAELDKSVGFIAKKKYVLYKVDVRNLHTQK